MSDTIQKLLTSAEAAEILGLTEQTLADWRYTRQGPRYLKLGHRTVRYEVDELAEWLEQNKKIPA